MPTWAEGVILSGQRRFTFEQTTDSMDMSLGKLWGLVIDRGLACCGPWRRKELDTTEQLN